MWLTKWYNVSPITIEQNLLKLLVMANKMVASKTCKMKDMTLWQSENKVIIILKTQ